MSRKITQWSELDTLFIQLKQDFFDASNPSLMMIDFLEIAVDPQALLPHSIMAMIINI